MNVRSLEWHAANGDVISFTQSPPFLLDTFMPGIPSGAPEVTRGVRTDGQTTHHVTIEPLTPTMTGSIIAAAGSYDKAQERLDRLRRRLQAALNPKRFGTLMYHNYSGSFRLRCRPITGAIFDKRFGNAHKIDIEWISDDPYWTAKDPQRLSVGLVRRLWRFPWAVAPTVFGSVLNAGYITNPTDIDIYPVITIASTESTSVTVGNRSTGVFTTINKSISPTQKLELDMAIPSVTLIDEDGTRTDATHWTTVDSVFPWYVLPGDNEIYSAVDNPELSPTISVVWHLPEGGL